MRFPLSLIKYNENIKLEDIINACNQIGLEIENVIDYKKDLEQFEVAYIKATSPHPNADRLKICTVQTKSGEELQIVCGAPNARPGIKVVLARVNTIIPNGNFKIKKSCIRGVDSCGMLCSSNELNISTEAACIVELDDDVNLTDKVEEAFGLDRPILELNITPNRGDCLSINGIVRDLNAYFNVHNKEQIKLADSEILSEEFNKTKLKDIINIKNEEEDFCHSFHTLIISNIQNNKTPHELIKKLNSLGIKTISPVIDILNYIMYKYGQPMHAYDVDTLTAKNDKIVIEIQNLKEDTEFIDLNETKHNIKSGNYVISNEGKAICIPGIIGSNQTKYTDETKNILIEAAFFNPDHIRIMSQNLNITSDSSFRFARHIDPKITKEMLIHAAYMIKKYCGGEITSFQEYKNQDNIQSKEILLNEYKIEKVCGIKIQNYKDILKLLGFNEIRENIWETPSWRCDFTCEENLIEEIARIYGYNQLDSEKNNSCEYVNTKTTNKDKIIEKLNQAILFSGFNEIITFPFTEKNYHDEEKIKIENPINKQQPFLRNSLTESLLKVIKSNFDKGNTFGKIYEIDKHYQKKDGIYSENSVLTAIQFGKTPKLWNLEQEKLDFYSIKKLAIFSLSEIGYKQDRIEFSSTKESQAIDESIKNIYHPYSSAVIKIGNETIGIVGEINPSFLQKIQLETECVGMEIFIDKLNYRVSSKKQPVDFSPFPEIARDFTFTFENINKNLNGIIKKLYSLSNLIKNISIKEIYNHNITLSVIIQSKEKTLEGNEINSISEKIEKYLKFLE